MEVSISSRTTTSRITRAVNAALGRALLTDRQWGRQRRDLTLEKGSQVLALVIQCLNV
jgi:hypothetical protein